MRLRSLLVLSLLAVGCSGGDEGADGERGTGSDAAYVDLGVDDAASADTSEVDVVTASDGAAADGSAVDSALDVGMDAGPHVCPGPSTPQDCSMGPGKGTADECHDAPSCFLKKVQKAVSTQVSTHPDWFDFTGPGGCPVIKNVDTFLDAVVADVSAQGLCIERDPNAPGEEVTVKMNNAFSENFDLVSSAGCARWGDPIYTGYCAPAWW